MMDDYKETWFPRHNREVAQISPGCDSVHKTRARSSHKKS